jgi:hypothetical protein
MNYFRRSFLQFVEKSSFNTMCERSLKKSINELFIQQIIFSENKFFNSVENEILNEIYY